MSRSLSSGAHSRDPLAHPGYGIARLLRSVLARSFAMVLSGEFQAMASSYP
jgi:hypothetical protein